MMCWYALDTTELDLMMMTISIIISSTVIYFHVNYAKRSRLLLLLTINMVIF